MKKKIKYNKINRGKWRKKTLHHISPTGTVEKYLSCPQQFWFDKISGLKKSEAKPYFIFGTAVHNANEEALKLKAENISVKDNRKHIMNAYFDYMEKEKDTIRPEQWGKTPYKAQLAQGKQMIELAIERYQDMPIKPIAIEKAFNQKWDDILQLNCKMDLIAEFTGPYTMYDGTKMKAGDIAILDHKTAARRYTASRVKSSVQLSFYAYVFRNEYMEDENFVGFQAFMKYKNPEIQDYISRRTEKDMIVLEETIDTIIKNIENGIFYPTYKSDTCDYMCDYKDICNKYCTQKARDTQEEKNAKSQGWLIEV